MLKTKSSDENSSWAKACTPKRWAFYIGVFGFLSLLSGLPELLVVQPLAADERCEQGPVALRIATCQFNHAVNDSSSLNATMWFAQLANDSGMWAWYGDLAWVYDANVAFWAYFHSELARITATVSPTLVVERVDWDVPMTSPRESKSNESGGYIIDYNTGSYYTDIGYYSPWNTSSDIGWIADNLTIVLTSDLSIRGVPLPLSSEYWRATVWWEKANLPVAQWNELADQLALQLNDTWYIKACTFSKRFPLCPPTETDETPGFWEPVLVGLLVLGGIGNTRRRGKRRRVASASQRFHQ